MMRHPNRLCEDERRQFGDILARCPEPTAADQLVRAFAQILTTRSGQYLNDWITAVRAENLPGPHNFAHGLEKDRDAVIQGLTTEWNSGPAEGRVDHGHQGHTVRTGWNRHRRPCVDAGSGVLLGHGFRMTVCTIPAARGS